jgi:probable O-glycosylation ligase (exosortase A-associated)
LPGPSAAARRDAADWWHPAGHVEPLPGGPSHEALADQASGSRVAFAALMTFTVILLLAPHTFAPFLVSLRPALLASGFAVAAYLVHCVVSGCAIVRPTAAMLTAGALAAWAIFTLPLGLAPGDGMAFVAFYARTLVIFWLLGHVVDTTARLRTAAWVLAAIGIPLAGTSIYHFVTERFIRSNAGPQRIAGYNAPLTADPNDLAMMLCLLLPLMIGLMRIRREPWMRLLLLGAVALTVVGVTLTYSRTGFVTLVTIAAVYAWRLRGAARRRVLAVFGILAVAIAAASPAYVERLATIFDKDSDPTGSAQERWDDSVVAVGLVLRHPLIGAGIGSSARALNEQRGPTNRDVHNVYLQHAVDLGLPGLVLFLALMGATFRSLRRVRERCAGHPPLRDLACLADALSVSLAAFAIGALLLPMAYRLHFYYFSGLAVAAASISENQP